MRVILLYSNECFHCKHIVEQLEKQPKISEIDIRLVEILSDEGMKLLEKFNIEEVPTAITEDGKECVIHIEEDKTVKIECNEI